MAVKKSKSSSSYRKFRFYIVSAVLGAIASGVALIIFSLFVFLLGIPVAQSGFFSLLAFGIGCIVAGFAAGAKKRQGGLATGIKAALLFTLPVALVGMFLGGFEFPSAGAEGTAAVSGVSAAIGVGTFSKVTIAILCGAVGGVLGVNRNGGF